MLEKILNYSDQNKPKFLYGKSYSFLTPSDFFFSDQKLQICGLSMV